MGNRANRVFTPIRRGLSPDLGNATPAGGQARQEQFNFRDPFQSECGVPPGVFGFLGLDFWVFTHLLVGAG